MSKNKKSVKRIIGILEEGLFIESMKGIFYKENDKFFYMETDIELTVPIKEKNYLSK